MFKILLILLFVLQNSFSKELDILGVWWSPKKDGRIEIYQEENKYFGKLIWTLPEFETNKDINNPDPKKKDQLLLGAKLLKDFIFKDGEYIEGKIYDPDNGKTYSCKMELLNKSELKVRGFIGISLFGRTEIFTRYKEN